MNILGIIDNVMDIFDINDLFCFWFFVFLGSFEVDEDVVLFFES